jgi:hypothetical protein
MKQYVASDITLYNDYVHVRGIGRVGLWWSKFDKQVCIDYSVGKSFYANNENEVKEGILNILNSKKD